MYRTHNVHSGRLPGSAQPFDEAIEATLTADGDQTILVLEVRGIPLDKIAFYGPTGRSTPRISPPTWLGASAATPRHAGTNSSLPIRTWRPTSASRRHLDVDARLHNAGRHAGERADDRAL
jgi:hypothetical protein